MTKLRRGDETDSDTAYPISSHTAQAGPPEAGQLS